MGKRTIKIDLSEEREQFIEWLAQRDVVSFQKELQIIFFTELRACEDLYMDEMKGYHLFEEENNDETERKENGTGHHTIRIGGAVGNKSAKPPGL